MRDVGSILLVWRILLLLGMSKLACASAADDAAETPPAVTNVADVVVLAEPLLTESSGLAFSTVRANRCWTHNDSGGKPQLFAFDAATGRRTGRCRLVGAGASDWEDLAAFQYQDRSCLLVADCGDNQSQRESIELYLIDEPDPDRVSDVVPWATLRVRYQDGARDCEAVAVDAAREQIILITKSTWPYAGIYLTPLPRPTEMDSATQAQQSFAVDVVARRVGTAAVPFVTGGDVDPNNGDLWIGNYFSAYHFPCLDRTSPIQTQLSAVPRHIRMPAWKQIEAISVQSLDRVWVTSEGVPAQLGRLSLIPRTSTSN